MLDLKCMFHGRFCSGSIGKFSERAGAQLEEATHSQHELIKAQQSLQVEQAAISEALAAFAPGLGAGKFLDAAFCRTWKVQAEKEMAAIGRVQ